MEPGSDQYQTLRDALQDMHGDTSAVTALLSALPDQGAGWVDAAYSELRRLLIGQRLSEGQELGKLIGSVLRAQEGGAQDELAENKIHGEAMRWLVEGIRAIIDRDYQAGIVQLVNLTHAVYSQDSLQWLAWHWISRAAAGSGDATYGLDAASQALDLALRLDIHSRAISVCTVGEMEHLVGRQQAAIDSLTQASRLFAECGDVRGMALTQLNLAKIHLEAGEADAALAAADRATKADPSWEQPVLFSARQALIAGDWRRAAAILESYQGEASDAIGAERRLTELLANETVPETVMARYCMLCDRPPSEQVVQELEQLIGVAPGFHQLQDLLAWTALKLGDDERARRCFELLRSRDLDPALRSSVLLGLGCLANRRHRHRHPSSRVSAAAAAAAPPPPPDAAPPPEDQLPEEVLVTSDIVALDETDSMELEVDIDLEFDEEEGGAAAMPASAPPLGALESMEIDIKVEDTPGETFGGGEPGDGDGAAGGGADGDSGGGGDGDGGGKSAFTGDLQLLAVPDLLEFLKSSRRTGTLVVTSEEGIGAVHLRDGMITGAASPGCSNLGDLLLKAGAVDSAKLKQATAQQRTEHPDLLLGALLVQQGVVPSDAVRAALLQQVQSVLLEMIGWTAGRFAFEPERAGDAGGTSEVEIALDTQSVLLDALREFDEQNR